jgi:hypothetical protein
VTPADVVIGIGGDTDLEALATRLGDLLGVRFEERDSGHYGTYYLAEPDGDEELRLYRNRDPIDGTPFVDDPDCAVLLRLLFTERDAGELAERIRTATHRGAEVLRQRS